MKVEEFYAVFMRCGTKGEPEILEVFISKTSANEFLDLSKENLRKNWNQYERKELINTNSRKRNEDKKLTEEQIEEHMLKFDNRIKEQVDGAIEVISLDKAIEYMVNEAVEVGRYISDDL